MADGVTINDPADSYEQSAEEAADAVSANGSMSPQPHSTSAAQPRHAASYSGGGERSLLVQREDDDTKKRLDEMDQKQKVLAKRVGALELDNLWRSKFGERYSSYKQAILRVTGGLDTATQAFQNALAEQAAIDQVWAQVAGGALSFICAFPMEWIALQAGGMLGKTGTDLEKFVEKFENPANALVAAGGNVNAAGVGLQNTAAAQNTPAPVAAVPYLSGSAIGFFSSNSEVVEHQSQLLEQAFVARGDKARAATDDYWEKFDIDAQEKTYQGIYDTLTSQVGGVEKMKDAKEVALVFERHLWAGWLRMKREIFKKQEKARWPEYGSATEEEKERHAQEESEDFIYQGLGSAVEDAMNKAGVSGLAGVTLTGHFLYLRISSDYKVKLK